MYSTVKNGFSLDPYTLVSHCYNNSELIMFSHAFIIQIINHTFFFIVVAPEVLSYEPLGLYTDMW